MKYEIRAVKLVGNNYQQCDENDPNAVWGLYEIGADNLAMHLSDHTTPAKAEKAMPTQTCVQTCGEYRNYYPCGKRAKFIDPKGRPLCGTHRAVVDRHYELMKSSERCEPVISTRGSASGTTEQSG